MKGKSSWLAYQLYRLFACVGLTVTLYTLVAIAYDFKSVWNFVSSGNTSPTATRYENGIEVVCPIRVIVSPTSGETWSILMNSPTPPTLLTLNLDNWEPVWVGTIDPQANVGLELTKLDSGQPSQASRIWPATSSEKLRATLFHFGLTFVQPHITVHCARTG